MVGWGHRDHTLMLPGNSNFSDRDRVRQSRCLLPGRSAATSADHDSLRRLRAKVCAAERLGLCCARRVCGRRVLFDTGNDADIFARNAAQLGVDLTSLDAVVISHRHGDHTTGLEVDCRQPGSPDLYAERTSLLQGRSATGVFCARRVSTGGHALLRWQGPRSAQRHALAARQFSNGDRNDGSSSRLLRVQHHVRQTGNTGNERIVARNPNTARLGGRSRVLPPWRREDSRFRSADRRAALYGRWRIPSRQDATRGDRARRSMLHGALKLQRVAPGHCTSEPGFAAFIRKFGDQFDRAGLGVVLPLPR